MLNNLIKASFAVIGFVTGFTLTRYIFFTYNINIVQSLRIILFIIFPVVTGLLFYRIANKAIGFIVDALDKAESFIHNMTLYELSISSLGLIAGLVVANLITMPISRVDIIGVPVSIVANILFGCTGIIVVSGKKNESLFEHFKDKKGLAEEKHHKFICPKVLDTSVIIDGRIADICRAGFLEGDIIIPEFVLEELRHIADSADVLKRSKGRRGLDVLGILQRELEIPVRVENMEAEGGEVDDKLLKVALKFKAKIVTNDYNLNKVAGIHGVSVLNINELVNALKPIAIPGEEMSVQVIKDGKENGQGIGYLDDGTMIVVEGGRKHIGESVNIVVTSVLQTAAGRMIFAKPKYSIQGL